MPVCDESGDIRSLKNHFRVIFKHSLSSRRIVLGADGKNDSTRFQLQGIALKGEVRLTQCAPLSEHDTFEPIIANHATPQGIVEVEHEAFFR